MPRVLVLGGSGLLGQYVTREARARGDEVWATYRGAPYEAEGVSTIPADLSDPASLAAAFEAARPEIAILCAAMTGVDACEERPDEARIVNADGPARVAELCAAAGSRLLHVSTDYVFDGEAGPYDEDAEPRPLGAYGATKRAGELAVLARLPGSAIVRACALYGWNRVRGKANSVTWILERVRRAEPVPLFTDQRVSPTYAADAARALLDLSRTDAHGVFHVAPPDCVTRLELGERVCEAFGLSPAALRPSTLREAALRAPRPRHSCLRPRRLEEALNTTVRPLREALAHMGEAE